MGESMKKKYIIEIDDEDRVVNGHIIIPFELSVEGVPGKVGFSYTIKNKLIPYAAPDLEQVRKEAYDKGYDDATEEIGSDEQAIADKAYQKGLSDAWDAARKISSMDSKTRDEIFGLVITSNIFDENTASEAIGKIKAYEQEQQIAIGDEVVFYNGEKCVVTVVGDGQVEEVMDENGFSMEMDDELRNSMKRTGRHFEELATILKKMKGE